MSIGVGRTRRRRPELNLVPLIDVLVMLVFFSFVTMQFKSAATLNITLPKVDTAGKNNMQGVVGIGIDKEGKLSFSTTPTDEREVSREELAALLQKVKEVDRNIPVLIKADQDTPLKDLAFVMDTCRKTGLNKFSLQSQK